VNLNDGLDGTWSNTTESGRGVAVDVLPQANGSAFVSGGVFSYGTDGEPTWLLFAGNFPAGVNSVSGIGLNQTSDGNFGAPFTAPTIAAVGSATVTFNSCRSMTVALDMNEASGLADVTLNLTPSQTNLGFAANPLCTETATLTTCPA
jgi:hypothetical protein